MSTTSAWHRNMIDAQLGSVVWATRMLPGSTSALAGSVTTTTRPSTVPGEAPVPVTVKPSAGPPTSTPSGSGFPWNMPGIRRVA